MKHQRYAIPRTQTAHRYKQTAVRLFVIESIGVICVVVLLNLKASVPLGLLMLACTIGTLSVYMTNILYITRICMVPPTRRPQAALSLATLTALYPLLALLLFAVRAVEA